MKLFYILVYMLEIIFIFMSNLVDYILSEVSIDERIIDGIFKMENNEHMDALFEYFTNSIGLSENDALKISNGMLEGKYPERQCYSKKSGRLVTYASKEKRDAMVKAGTHTLQPPNKPAKEEPAEKPLPNMGGSAKDEPLEQEPQKQPNIFQGSSQLEVEPLGGQASAIKSEPTPITPPTKTPPQNAAEEMFVKQIINTDNTTLSNLTPSLKEELKVLFKEAAKLKLNEAASFLIDYI